MAQEIEESLRAFLISRQAVTDLVGIGAAARVRPDRLAQGDSLPAVIIEVDNETPQNDIDGVGGLVYCDVNIKCRAAQKKDSRELAEAVRTNRTFPGTGLAGYHGLAGNQIIDGVLEDMQTSFVPARDGSDEGYYDTDMSFVVSLEETT